MSKSFLYHMVFVLTISLTAALAAGCGRSDDQGQAALLAASPEELAELLANAPEVAVPPDFEPPPDSYPLGTPGTGEGSRQFVGQVIGTEIFVGMYLDHSQVMAYVCDGIPEEAPWTVKEWFTGPVVNGRFELTSSAGLGLSGMVTNGLVAGTLTLVGETELAYGAELAGEGAGLRREVNETDSGLVADGWITLPDGQVRGPSTSSASSTCVCSGSRIWCRNCSTCSWYRTASFCWG
jgi:hypothetical protein